MEKFNTDNKEDKKIDLMDSTEITGKQSSESRDTKLKSVSTACRPAQRLETRSFVRARRRCMNPYLAVSLLLLALTLLAALVGALVGYTYCRYERRRPGNSSEIWANGTAEGGPPRPAGSQKINAAIAYVFGTKLRQLFTKLLRWNQ